MSKKNNALTLIELLIVMVVIGVVAGFAVPNFNRARRNAIDREAQAMLVLIRAAEQARAAEGRGYQACADVTCNNTFDNNGLGLDLPIGGNWNYTVTTPNNTTFCARATGNHGTSNWYINQDFSEAQAGDACP